MDLLLNYAGHPAFAGLKTIDYDRAVCDLHSVLKKQFSDCLLQAQFDSVSVQELWDTKLQKCVQDLFDLMHSHICSSEVPHLSQYFASVHSSLKKIIIADLKDAKRRFGSKMPLDNLRQLEHYEALLHSRFTRFSFSPAQIEELKQDLSEHMATILSNYHGGAISREELTIGKVPGLVCKKLTEWFAEGGVIQALSAYMGRPFRVFGFALELSVPEATWWQTSYPEYPETGAETFYYHIDQGRAAPKAIVYLSDVDEDCGPTQFVPWTGEWFPSEIDSAVARCIDGLELPDEILEEYARTSSQDFLRNFSSVLGRKHFFSLPTVLQYSGHFGWDVYTDSILQNVIASHQETLLGLAGTCVCFDGSRLLHRGGVDTKKLRWVLQVVFGEVP